jgi:outer membrane lipoprotein-sorting protein
MRLRRLSARLVVGFCVWGWMFGSAAAAQEPDAAGPAWGLPQLMLSLARVRSASAKFVERKTVRMLDAPLVSTGTLNYVAPDRMTKVTLSPRPETVVLDGDEVTIEGGPDGQTHTFSITDYPQIGGLVEGIRATLAGDLPALERYFDVRLSGRASDWQLLLQPKDDALARLVTSIRILGRENRIHRIETDQSDGDRSEMTIVEGVRVLR